MPRTNFQELLDARVHFGHLARKWNPKMAPYIFDQKGGIHIIDLHKSIVKIEEAANVLKQLARSGRKILFVATKKQAKDIVAEKAAAVNMPYVTERWPGGMLTNFPTIRKAVKKMSTIDKMIEDGTFDTLAKRERLQITRQRAKLEKNLGSIKDLNRLPSALFVVDIQKEMNAVREANRLNIPVIAMVDTCCDPTPIDYVIPANDDAAESISLIVDILCRAIQEGLEERKMEKDKEEPEQKTEQQPKTGRKLRARKTAKPAEEVEEEEKPKKAPAKKAPAKKAEEAPVKEVPAKEAKTEKVEKTPAKEKTVKAEKPAETPAKEAKAEKVPAKEVKKEEPKAEKKEAPVKETPAKETSVKEVKAEAKPEKASVEEKKAE